LYFSKKSRPSDPVDYKPVALTCHVMKVMDRLVLAQLRPHVRTVLDHFQFAYQPHLGVDDAVIYLLQRAHMHLDGGGDTVRITLFDFSSAFNAIQPLLLGEELRGMGVHDLVISWVTDYLTGRPQFVRLGSVLSDVVVSDIRAPQGTVLSPFLFTLYTTDFQYNSESRHLQKFSDDSTVVGCIREGEAGEYRTLVDNFVEWSEQNHLRLNVSKTREMVINFRRKKTPSQPLRIRGQVVEEVEDYKIIRKAGSALGLRLESFETVVERRTLNKLLSIMDNKQAPLHHTVVRQRNTFSHRLPQLRCQGDRCRKSFLPHAITLYNKS